MPKFPLSYEPTQNKAGRIKLRRKVSRRHGNGTLRYEVWQENGVVTYNLAYINHLIYSGDNGRVIGYDNRHGHHRHCKGTVEAVDETNFAAIERRFEQEWSMMLEEYNAQRNPPVISFGDLDHYVTPAGGAEVFLGGETESTTLLLTDLYLSTV